MEPRQALERLERALTPARHRLDGSRRGLAVRIALLDTVQMLPRIALGLALGFAGAQWIDGEPLFDPWLLPVVLVLVPVAAAAAQWLRMRAGAFPADAYEAALACDRAVHNRDRWSAAVEFAEDPRPGGDRPATLRRAAIEDGVGSLDRLRPELARDASPPVRAAPGALLLAATLAAVIALLPAVLLSPATSGDPSPNRIATADQPPTTGTGETTDTPTTPRPETAAPDARSPVATPIGPRSPSAEESDDQERGRPTATGSRAKAGAGTGSQAGGRGGGDSGEATGSPRSAAAGRSARRGAGGGGQGSAQSQGSSERKNETSPKPRPARPAGRRAETRPGDQDPSANTPSGPSRGAGRMTAVGNQRAGLERGSERDDETDTEDEEVEDEQEESEQRGGVMPMTRDRQSPAARELGISGDGPPNDGRGGPTPPKKSRGTASLVLGIRLPDQVRGQPNAGTAKTSIEQVPPQSQAGPTYEASPAVTSPPSRVIQSRVPDPGSLDPALRAYYEALGGPRPPSR